MKERKFTDIVRPQKLQKLSGKRLSDHCYEILKKYNTEFLGKTHIKGDGELKETFYNLSLQRDQDLSKELRLIKQGNNFLGMRQRFEGLFCAMKSNVIELSAALARRKKQKEEVPDQELRKLCALADPAEYLRKIQEDYMQNSDLRRFSTQQAETAFIFEKVKEVLGIGNKVPSLNFSEPARTNPGRNIG